MSKKDFIALADAIRRHNQTDKHPFTADQLQALANFCRNQNYAFKEQRWLDYIDGKCGPNGGRK